MVHKDKDGGLKGLRMRELLLNTYTAVYLHFVLQLPYKFQQLEHLTKELLKIREKDY